LKGIKWLFSMPSPTQIPSIIFSSNGLLIK
jgi:hypothetical protein